MHQLVRVRIYLKRLQKGYCPKVAHCFRWTYPPDLGLTLDSIPPALRSTPLKRIKEVRWTYVTVAV